MRKGFIFSYELCVGCKACSAACMLENGWKFKARNIYSSNENCFTPDPVISLSMACNHCDDPACLVACPSGAYKKDPVSGAVKLDSGKCLGCNYCRWNCPYSAPKYNYDLGIIEKCHLCYHRLEEGIEPACSSSCPTGALAFGEIPGRVTLENYDWMPEKELNPALLILGREKYDSPSIVPEMPSSGYENQLEADSDNKIIWSLAGFTFLTILSVAISITRLISGGTAFRMTEAILAFLAAIFSLFHLGSKLKAWRAISNLKSSPLSREIAVFILYGSMVISDLFSQIPYGGIIISVTGVLLIVIIDSVYSFSQGRRTYMFHSGQAFLTVMLISSFLLNAFVPFIFIALIKIGLSVRKIRKERETVFFILRFMRLAFLLISIIIMLSGVAVIPGIKYMIFFSGEIADRLIFYVDFRTLKIRDTMRTYNSIDSNPLQALLRRSSYAKAKEG